MAENCVYRLFGASNFKIENLKSKIAIRFFLPGISTQTGFRHN